ncbi:MAG: beta-mannosidase, partial [Streptomycetaceae bacterium]|nr:beta-mannosidase [Streptomycetaceae bacterium]
SVSASPSTGGACTATNFITNSWPGGFSADVHVKAGAAPINGWTAKWTFANGQVISSLWNGVMTVSGPTITVKNQTWNGSLAAGAEVWFGFNASSTGTNAVPTVTCTSP